jgi:hypothetical protein
VFVKITSPIKLEITPTRAQVHGAEKDGNPEFYIRKLETLYSLYCFARGLNKSVFLFI